MPPFTKNNFLRAAAPSQLQIRHKQRVLMARKGQLTCLLFFFMICVVGCAASFWGHYNLLDVLESAESPIPLKPDALPSTASPPLRRPSIFVSLAAYRDDECVTTVESALVRAADPRRVFFGISEERETGDRSCVGLPELLNQLGLTRRRRMQWQDVLPDSFEGNYGLGVNPVPLPNVAKPLLHVSRMEEVLECTFAKDFLENPNATGQELLNGCQLITRVARPVDARGPTYARYLTSLLYNNQDYYMVVDSHSRFVPNWDDLMIRRVLLMPTQGILSHYPNGYTPQNPDAEVNKKDIMLMCKGVIMYNDIPKLGARWISSRSTPVLQGFAAAGYMFGDARFVKDVPFDPYLPYLFDGEESLYSARLWTSGWDLYAPGAALIYHNYERHGAPRYFEHVRGEKKLLHVFAQRRVLYLLERNKLNSTNRLVSEQEATVEHPMIGHEKKRFGLGTARSIQDYWRFVQLTDDFITKKDSEGRWMGGEGLCDAGQRP